MAKDKTQSADVPEPVFDRGPSGVGETSWQNRNEVVGWYAKSVSSDDQGVNDGAWSIYDETREASNGEQVRSHRRRGEGPRRQPQHRQGRPVAQSAVHEARQRRSVPRQGDVSFGAVNDAEHENAHAWEIHGSKYEREAGLASRHSPLTCPSCP